MEVLSESYGGGRERGEGSVTGERKAEVPDSQGTEPVQSGQGVPRRLCSSPRQAQLRWSEWRQAFSVPRSNQKVIQIPGREVPSSCLGPLPTS